MFGNKTQMVNVSRGNPLVMPEAAQTAFEKLIEPSEAVKLTRKQLQKEIGRAHV